MNKKSYNGSKFTIIISAILFVATILSITFAYFSPVVTGESYELMGLVNAEVANITFSGAGGYTLTNTYPMVDEDGINASYPYDFSVTNNETKNAATIYIILETFNSNTLENSLINFNISQRKSNKEEILNFTKTLSDNETITPLTANYDKAYKIYSTTISAGETANFSLKAWINEKGTVDNAQNKTWTSKIIVRGYKTIATADKTLAALNLKANSGTPNFNTISTTDEGLFAAEDDYGTSYYFRGAVENNYVKFAGFYWRIIRINGDGSIRIIYDGTKAHTNGTSSSDRRIAKTVFNTLTTDNAYEGYMYGLAGTTTTANRCLKLEDETVVNVISTYKTESACIEAGGKWTDTAYKAAHANVKDSTIKEIVDAWYKTNIMDKGHSYAVSDTLFCNDRSLYSGTGAGAKTSKYSANNRLLTNKTPTLKCAQKNDSFTVTDEAYGNGDLTYPVGLITADEISLAGGKYYVSSGTSNNSKYYLYKGHTYWSMTPYRFESDAYLYENSSTGAPRGYRAYYEHSVVPVINLKPEMAQNMLGNGKIDNPYRIPSTESEKTLAALNQNVNSGTPDFNTIATTDEGIYQTEDNYGTSFYFRGATENNYVKFAGFYWRIIRINGDGSLRIIYDGTKAHANGTSSSDRRISKTVFNTLTTDNANGGYMYGLANKTTDAYRCLILENNSVVDKVSTYKTEFACIEAGGKWTDTAYKATHANVKDSTIKEIVDAWYKTNIMDKGQSYAVSDTLFCNDRSLYSGYGTGTNITKYSAFNRLLTNKTPTLKCAQKNDAFTVDDETNGNGDLTYPVGLITADEISLAGGKYYVSSGTSNNTQYYLYKGVAYWSITPHRYENDAYLYEETSNGSFRAYRGFYERSVVPVINLNSDYVKQLKGSGTITEPYTVS